MPIQGFLPAKYDRPALLNPLLFENVDVYGVVDVAGVFSVYSGGKLVDAVIGVMLHERLCVPPPHFAEQLPYASNPLDAQRAVPHGKY
jgi:hypothetical protein